MSDNLGGVGMTVLRSATIADAYWWPVVPVVTAAASAAAVAGAVYFASTWAARDREAREVHRALTTGDGGAARAKLSHAEYKWWSEGESPVNGHGATFDCDRDLLEAFYVLDASLTQLAIVLARYSTSRRRSRRQVRYRSLLGWHAGIHIAWLIWFIGAASTVKPYEPVRVPARLEGVRGRLRDILEMIGDHQAKVEPPMTVRVHAREELRAWVVEARKLQQENNFDEHIEAVVNFADEFVGPIEPCSHGQWCCR
jgi:hypothetical protein